MINKELAHSALKYYVRSFPVTKGKARHCSKMLPVPGVGERGCWRGGDAAAMLSGARRRSALRRGAAAGGGAGRRRRLSTAELSGGAAAGSGDVVAF